MEIRIVREPINIEELRNIAKNQFGTLVKAVVDVELEVMAVGGELHSDEEIALADAGSKRENTWGVSLYPEKSGDDFIEFDSMINIKPQYGNVSRGVENPEIREKIKAVVRKLVLS
jgi:hypothetical protein